MITTLLLVTTIGYGVTLAAAFAGVPVLVNARPAVVLIALFGANTGLLTPVMVTSAVEFANVWSVP